MITFSIVSHNQGALVNDLLLNFSNLNDFPFDLIVTSNTVEDVPINKVQDFQIKIIRNSHPKGFGANHNQAFANSLSNFFVVLNPDIRFKTLNIKKLISHFTDKNIGIVSPSISNSQGLLEDSARQFPTFSKLILKSLGFDNYILPQKVEQVDWVAGMFMLIPREVFLNVKGFDDNRFFMYYEDVDLCSRVKKMGYRIIYDPTVSIVHDARRASRRNLRHMKWHLTSMFRYLSGI